MTTRAKTGADGEKWATFEVEVEVTIRRTIRVEAHVNVPSHVAEQARHAMWSKVYQHGVQKDSIVVGNSKRI